jgi:hypothetical protein
MFVDKKLNSHLEESSSINSRALVIAEWNMNFSDNIEVVGNYRYRPTASQEDSDGLFSIPQSYFDRNDAENQIQFYTGATDADVLIDGGLDDKEIPKAFLSPKEKEAQLYSLEDCFGKFRPRSGINKARFFANAWLGFDHPEMFARPRVYMGSKEDKFKYWSSYRTDSGTERGVSKKINGTNFIDDAAPFVVYKEQVPANRIVVKMQTGVGTVNLGPFQTGYSSIGDPFFGDENKRVPVRWRVQKLVNDFWQDLAEFSETSARDDGTPVIKEDGYVELSYGIIVPDRFRNSIVMSGSFASSAALPDISEQGEAFLVGATSSSAGTVYIWNDGEYESFVAEYGWKLREDNDSGYSGVATKLVYPESFELNGNQVFREIDYLSGIRIVVQTMNTTDTPFELIEISPRLAVDMTDRTVSFSITKSASDLGTSGMPVGQLLASTGTLSIFDYDSSLNENNENSIVAKYTTQNLKVAFYDDIFADGTRYLVPIKTMYADGFPEISIQDRQVSIPLRDLYMRLESMQSPELFLQNVSTSYAIATLLDNIGFSNYVFKRVEGESDQIIPSFFVQPGKTVAEVLQDIATSTQTAMFFDEYNNFVVMSKRYMLPEEGDRDVDVTLSGSTDYEKAGVIKNARTSPKLANILSISSVLNNLYNDGAIRYFVRHIQRSYGSLKQSSLIDKDKSWIYKPVLLWEIGASAKTKSQGDDSGEQSAYVLSAIPLSTVLSSNVPEVINGEVVNNTIDFGEGVYWLSRYNGYFFSNGEVIRYDAAEYSVAGIGNVWISSAQEYNRYFSNLPFNGKMYPTGIVRIYSEPNSDIIDGIVLPREGAVASHGRGQFNTPIVEHSAGISTYWTDPSTVRGCEMQSKFLFSDTSDFDIDGASSERVRSVDRPLLSANGSTKTYTLESPTTPIPPGSYVTVTGFEPESANVSRALVVSSSRKTFTVSSSISSSDEGSTGKIEEIARPDLIGEPSEQRIYVLDATKLRAGMSVELVGGVGEFRQNSKIATVVSNDENTSFFTVDKKMNAPILSKDQYLTFFQEAPPETNFINTIRFSSKVDTEVGPAGVSNEIAKKSYRTGIIKNFLSSSSVTETQANTMTSTESGTIQSSALILQGNDFNEESQPLDFITYVHKPLENKFVHFGTRLRVVGRVSSSDKKQIPEGGMPYFSISASLSDENISISGGSGGIGVLVNPETNVGYYLELIALSEADTAKYSDYSNVNNIIFYKIMKDSSSEDPVDGGKAIPVKLWSGIAQIVVDDGLFTGQSRMFAEESPSVYDISVEYIDESEDRRKFYLYLNNKLVSVVDDNEPLPIYNNVALFSRGTSRIMFENVFAITNNYSQNSVATLDVPIASSIYSEEITVNDAFRKYAMSGILQNTYLAGISPSEPPKYSIYFDEFGTIMREASYIKAKYDRAYPALYAQISPTFNNIKGYTVSGFIAGPYEAEFLVFNNTDTAINLDETTGNYLRIQGIAFTQQTQQELTVDQFLSEGSDLSTALFKPEATLDSANKIKGKRFSLQSNRMTYGRREFSIEPFYIQSEDSAREMMQWMIDKTMKKRLSVGASIFGLPTLQLGDIVKIDYKDNLGVNEVSSSDTKFVVYSIEHSRDSSGPTMNVYLSEVI